MSDIEAEIRRQMLEERDRALRSQPLPPSGAPSAPYAGHGESSPPPASPSYHSLPPPSFPQGGPSYPAHYPPASYPPQSQARPHTPLPAVSAAPKSPPRKGILGGMGAIGILLAKLGSALKFLTFGKYFLTAGTMMLSILAWSALYGWRLGVGVAFLILFHELGHVFAIKRLGHQVTAMVFVPFMGAYVKRERVGNAAEAAQIAIMGPVAGLLTGLACGSVYGMTGSPIWLVLAYFSFYMNLFNLSAIPFLDGGRVTPLIPPKVLLIGLIAVAAINYRCPVSWLMLLFAAPQIIERWKLAGLDPSLQVTKQEQQTYTLAYFGMALFMGFASITTQDWLWELRRLGRAY